ncbi:hypothetical protein CORC01_06883 [Colletotrichum orchidophilum]|uniref:Uncharacterized protein n=1 Tax=Colletotrichum orchidophilum TaxID=1209926 RepID=A0A1G4B8R9_9PEZI|nr:uncharacterized protein CORC01_06883 [Colletotrichum orchidophilum]OHE97848.1 hypothetical protein CORC01_06883 [Colletotrichum orchidophilum]
MSVEFDVISRETTSSPPSDWTRPSHLAFFLRCSSLLHVIKRDSWGDGRGTPHANCASAGQSPSCLPPFLCFVTPRSCSSSSIPSPPLPCPSHPHLARGPPPQLAKFCPTMLRLGREVPRIHPLRRTEMPCRHVAPPLIPHPQKFEKSGPRSYAEFHMGPSLINDGAASIRLPHIPGLL